MTRARAHGMGHLVAVRLNEGETQYIDLDVAKALGESLIEASENLSKGEPFTTTIIESATNEQ